MCLFNAAMSQICNHTLYDIESPPETAMWIASLIL